MPGVREAGGRWGAWHKWAGQKKKGGGHRVRARAGSGESLQCALQTKWVPVGSCYLSSELASAKEEGAHTPHTELPSPGLESPGIGEAVLAPRPHFMAGCGFQKKQGMAAGRRPAVHPPGSTCPAPFSPSDPERSFCFPASSPAVPWLSCSLLGNPNWGD